MSLSAGGLARSAATQNFRSALFFCREPKRNEIPASVKAVAPGIIGSGHDSKRSRSVHISIMSDACGEEIVPSNVHNDEVAVIQKSTTVRSRNQSMPVDIKR